MVAVGRYFLTQKTRLRLSAAENKVRMLRTSMFDAKEYEINDWLRAWHERQALS